MPRSIPAPQSRPQPVASARHTCILAGILLAIALAGLLSSLGATSGTGQAMGGLSGIGLYLPLLAAELGMLYYVRLGLRGRGLGVRDLIGERALDARSLATDMLLGLLLLAAWLGLEYCFDRLLGPSGAAQIRPLLVRQASQIPLWIVLAITAGLVEEITFRGYFQRQFASLLGSLWLGVAAQALLFGVTHGYQGVLPVIKISLFGLLFGAVALRRRSLVPGIFAHAAVDIIGGLALLC
jgi:membrane protease YdiL (CAAX protease family)